MPQYQMPRLAQVFGGASAAAPQSLAFLMGQPDLARFARLDEPRYRSDAPRILSGAVSQQSYVFAVGQPQGRRFTQLPKVKTPIDVAPVVVAQTYEFTVSQPDLARATAVLQALRYQVPTVPRVHESTAAAATQSQAFPLSQPTTDWFARADLARLLGGSVARLETTVTVVPQSYVFSLSQPVRASWPVAAPTKGAPDQLAGPTTHATYVFVPNQPELQRYRLLERARRLGGSVAYPLDTFLPDPVHVVRDAYGVDIFYDASWSDVFSTATVSPIFYEA